MKFVDYLLALSLLSKPIIFEFLNGQNFQISLISKHKKTVMHFECPCYGSKIMGFWREVESTFVQKEFTF